MKLSWSHVTAVFFARPINRVLGASLYFQNRHCVRPFVFSRCVTSLSNKKIFGNFNTRLLRQFLWKKGIGILMILQWNSISGPFIFSILPITQAKNSANTAILPPTSRTLRLDFQPYFRFRWRFEKLVLCTKARCWWFLSVDSRLSGTSRPKTLFR